MIIDWTLVLVAVIHGAPTIVGLLAWRSTHGQTPKIDQIVHHSNGARAELQAENAALRAALRAALSTALAGPS